MDPLHDVHESILRALVVIVCARRLNKQFGEGLEQARLDMA